MELRHLRYFVCVAEAGSFTQAATRLHTVQSSLSRQIKDLENYLGVTLFERSTRQMSLTPSGTVFLDEARLVLSQADRAVERARQTARVQSQTLALGFLLGVEMELLARVMSALSHDLIPVTLTLHNKSSPELINALHNREIDAAFVRPSEDCAGLTLKHLRHERLAAAVPAEHPLATLATVTAQQLAQQNFINVAHQHAPVLRELVDRYFESVQVALTSTYEAENLSMALSLIRSMGGVTLLPEYAQQLYPAGVVSVPLSGQAPTIELALAYHPENLTPALEAFLRVF